MGRLQDTPLAHCVMCMYTIHAGRVLVWDVKNSDGQRSVKIRLLSVIGKVRTGDTNPKPHGNSHCHHGQRGPHLARVVEFQQRLSEMLSCVWLSTIKCVVQDTGTSAGIAEFSPGRVRFE